MKRVVIKPFIVARCLARLREEKTHSLFAGYLYLQQRATELQRLDDLRPDFLQFYKKFFEVSNHPLGTPYIKVFTEQRPSKANLWLNENIAGSYAPSSLRPNQPFRRVVEIEQRKYSLPANHAMRAKESLLYGRQVQAAELAVVLYRDYGFVKRMFSIYDLISIFGYEFGYSVRNQAALGDDFNLLFSLESAAEWDEEWLEGPRT